MPKGKTLAETIKARAAGLPHDEDTFMSAVENLALSCYHQRYKGLAPPPKEGAPAKSRKAAFIPPDADKLEDGTVIVGRDHFIDLCWQAMNSDLLLRVADIEFLNDSALAGYLKRAFESLLQREINKLNPGLETRTRQIRRVLKRFCDETNIQGKRCWLLKSVPAEPGCIAGPDAIARAGQDVRPPSKRTRRKDSSHGVSYSDTEVARYLSELLERCGGAVLHNDLIAYLKKIFEIESIREIEPPAVPKGTEHLRLSMEHRLVADDIFKSLDRQMRDLYWYLTTEEMTGREIAARLGISEASVSARRKRLLSLLEKHLHDPDTRFDPDECRAILCRLTALIHQERQ